MDTITASGLRLEGASGDWTIIGIQATSDWSEVGQSDLIIIATKAAGVGPVAAEIAPFLTSETLVLALQNGLGAGERIAQHMPTDNVLLGVADGFGASIKAPGRAYCNAMNLIRIGEIDGGLTDRAETLAATWRGAGSRRRPSRTSSN